MVKSSRVPLRFVWWSLRCGRESREDKQRRDKILSASVKVQKPQGF